MSDQAIFWGWQVFWWKRAITVAQLFLAATLFVDLLKPRHKKAVSRSLDAWRQRAAGINVRKVIRLRTLLFWFGLIVTSFSTGVAIVLHQFVRQNGQPVSFWAAWFVLVFFLGIIAFCIGQIVVGLSTVWTTVQHVRKITPPLLAWMFHHQRFDVSAKVVTFILLAIVTTFSLIVS